MTWPRREARTPDYRSDAGLVAAMLGDSTVRDFAIRSSLGMLVKQWTPSPNDPFLNADPANGIDSVFERLARRGPVCAVRHARSGASVGPPRTWARRRFQRFANVKTLGEQIDELFALPVFPHVTLVWIGHNNLDFVTELPRFSPRGDVDEALRALRASFARHLRTDLSRLVERAESRSRRSAVVVYGLVNPESTRRARDLAREIKAREPGRFPYLARTEARFPPLRPEHGDRLVALSRMLSDAIRETVSNVRSALAGAPHVSLLYSDETVRMEFSEPWLLSDVDAWHASRAGMATIARALFAGLEPALEFVGEARRR